MEIRNIRTFIKAAELGSFSKAGLELGYAQSTVTLQMQQLEEELGVSLFDRQGKKLSLSQNGRTFLLHAYQLINCERSARQALSPAASPAGQLRIGMVESLSVSAYADIFQKYMKAFPDVTLIVKIATTLELMALLEKGSLDVILLLDRKIVHDDWLVPLEKPETIIFFCDPHHPLAQKTVHLSEIAHEKFLLVEKGCNYRQVFEDRLAEQRLLASCCLEIGSTHMIIDYVKARLGISLLPAFCLETELQQQTIAQIFIKDCPLCLYAQIIYNKHRGLTPALQAFLSLAKPYFTSTCPPEPN